ncbi:MAG: hypothetical protein KA354_08225 [Phycisphaerae bacterium]|nr:hypothetical protein [Phycisphaerae bacterium]
MPLLLTAIGLLLVGGLAALCLSRDSRRATIAGAGTAICACLIGLGQALATFGGGSLATLRWPWSVPYGSFFVQVDAVSAFFLVTIFAVCGLAAVYGIGYMRSFRERKSSGRPWFFFNLLVAGMALVVMARNGVLFLMAWEIMSLASFFLVTVEDEREEVRRAGWTYLVATHIGTAFLLALFALLGRHSGSLDFDGFITASGLAHPSASLLFILALIGFGTKAGIMPLHVWLPEAHPAAPSHVSAIMSGVMIKTGIYGLLRTLTFLGPPPAWWGYLLVGIGLISGVLGVLFALAQHDLKRLLAYHSVENIGIIVLGLGLGLLGLSWHSTPLAVLGFGGGLLHVLNHAVFKSLLFLGAGSVLHSTGTREIDGLGGLLKPMPWTGAVFLIGAAAISALPPLNGFASEFLIYLGAFRCIQSLSSPQLPALLAAIAGLALIGGLAAACFTKAFGAVFLGEPRSEHAHHAHECGPAMRWPMIILAAACGLIGLLSPFVVMAMASVIESACGLPAIAIERSLVLTQPALTAVVVTGMVAALLFLALNWTRSRLLATRPVTRTVTWDCGYARPTARMQYTASSFAQPLIQVFHVFLRTRTLLKKPLGYFPSEASLATHTPDICEDKLYRPAFLGTAKALSKLRWLQHGRVQVYILYIAITLLALLAWRLG